MQCQGGWGEEYMLFIMHHDVYNFVYGIFLCWITSGANQHSFFSMFAVF